MCSPLYRAFMLGSMAVIWVAACATTPPAFSTIERAELRIAHAEQVGASQVAAPEMSQARERLEVAKIMVREFAYEDAYDAAQESLALAELASLKAKLAVSNEAVKDARTRSGSMAASQGATP